MSIATLEEVATWDDEGNVEGFQFDSRERRIQEWREKKEAEEFAALVDRLQKRNSARRAMADPVSRERIKKNERRHRESGRKQQRANERRREKYEADPIVNVCEQCGHIETVPFDKKGVKRSRFCSRSCRNKHHGSKRQRPTKGLRQMDTREKTFAFLRTVSSATAEEVAEAVGGKLGSVRTCLCRWAKAGELATDGGKPARYSIT